MKWNLLESDKCWEIRKGSLKARVYARKDKAGKEIFTAGVFEQKTKDGYTFQSTVAVKNKFKTVRYAFEWAEMIMKKKLDVEVDVWKLMVEKGGAYLALKKEELAMNLIPMVEEMEECDGFIIEKTKMKRGELEGLPEFEGF